MKTKGLMPVIEKKDKAVSPIIATILLVAITVILASTLYLALGGFFTAKTSATPSVALTAASTGTDTWSITISSTSSNTISWSSTSFVITYAGGTYTLSYENAGSWYQGTTPSTVPGWANTTASTGATSYIVGISGSYVSSGVVLSLTIVGPSSAFTPTSIAFEDTSTTNGGQMGATSL